MSRWNCKRRAIAYDAWPRCDRNAWKRATRSGGPFDNVGAGAKWAPATRKWLIASYGAWLSFYAERRALTAARHPSERITRTAVEEYINDVRPRVAPCTLTNLIVALKVMAKAMEPERNWHWLELVSNALGRFAEPQRDKLSRMRPLSDVVGAAVSNLERLEATLLRSRADRIAFRDSLMLALIAVRPLRLKNFVQLELGRHILNTRSPHPMIAIPSNEVKNRLPLEYTFPHSILRFTHVYLDRVRSTFANSDSSNALWVAYAGTPISINEARYRIKRLSKKLLGVDINPHLFRDIAATDIAEFEPEGIFTAAAVLGHRNPKTTGDYYVRANRLGASRQFNLTLEKIALRLKRGTRTD